MLAFEELPSICDPVATPWHAFNTLFSAVTASGIPKKSIN